MDNLQKKRKNTALGMTGFVLSVGLITLMSGCSNVQERWDEWNTSGTATEVTQQTTENNVSVSQEPAPIVKSSAPSAEPLIPDPTVAPTPTIAPSTEPTKSVVELPKETEKLAESDKDSENLLLMPNEMPTPLGLAPLSGLTFPTQKDPFQVKFGSAYDGNGKLSNESMAWYYGKNNNYQVPTAQTKFDIRPFGGYYVGDISQKVIYLTFDEGYENGYTVKILDILKEKNVTAAFFVTKPYIESQTDLVKRMVAEGHIVGNHTVKHKSSPTLSDAEMKAEIMDTATYYESVIGSPMPKFFRPPMGEYSARTLKITHDLGYKTIFWSFAYADWDVKKQPGTDKAYTETVTHMHYGAIPLLHAVSESNTEALPHILDTLKAEGFTFQSLNNLPVYAE